LILALFAEVRRRGVPRSCACSCVKRGGRGKPGEWASRQAINPAPLIRSILEGGDEFPMNFYSPARLLALIHQRRGRGVLRSLLNNI
jgi:hypothetical protein